MPLLDELRAHRDEILKLAAECGLTDVRVFGSVARGEERVDSDIDILVSYGPNATLLKHGGFITAMEDFWGRKIDAVEDKRLHWVIRDDVLQEAKPL